MPVHSRRDLLLPTLGVSVALVIRVLALLADRDSLLYEVGGLDAPQYLEMARAFGEGKWPDERPFFWAPGYSLFLGVLTLLSKEAVLAKLVQIGLGTLSCALVGLLAARLFAQPRVTLLSIAVAAVYGPLVYYDLQISPATLDVFLFLLLLVLLLEAERRDRAWLFLAAGLVAALAAITRGAVLLFLPIAVVWVLWVARKGDRTRAGSALRSAVAALALLVPVLIAIGLLVAHNRRYDDGKRPAHRATMAASDRSETSRTILISYNFGINFLLGNVAGLHAHNRVEDPLCFLDYKLAMDEPMRLGQTRPSAQSDFVFRKALTWIASHPAEWLALTARKAFELLHGDEISRDTSIYGSRTDNEVLALLLFKRGVAFPSGLLIPFALLGLVLVSATAGGLGRRHALVLAALSSQALFVLAFFVTTRYRLPLLAAAIPYAAYAAVTAVDFVRSRGSVARPRNALAIALGLALLVLCNLGLSPMPPGHEPFEFEHLGSVLAARGLTEQATGHWQRAVAIDPSYAPSHFQLGRRFMRSGDLERADSHFTAGLHAAPSAWPARLEHARLLVQLKRRGEAVDQIRLALTEVTSLRLREMICFQAEHQGLDVQAACR